MKLIERGYRVADPNDGGTRAQGIVLDIPTRANNTAINAGAAVAELLGLDPITSVTAHDGKFKPVAKARVKDGEPPYKAVAV
jgi:hypothetical protein